MTTKLNLSELLAIYESCDAYISHKDAIETLNLCNLYAVDGSLIQGKYRATAEGWAMFYAQQEAEEQNADYKATLKFHNDVYGDD